MEISIQKSKQIINTNITDKYNSILTNPTFVSPIVYTFTTN